MTTNSRQIQSFTTNPVFVWKHSDCIESYTFKLEKKDSPCFLIWEDTFTLENNNWQGTKGINLESIEIEGTNYLTLSDLPTLSELVTYSISGIAKSEDKSIYAYSDMIVIESKVQKSMKELEKKIDDLRSSDSDLSTNLRNSFDKFISDTLSFADTGPVPKWTRPPICIFINY